MPELAEKIQVTPTGCAYRDELNAFVAAGVAENAAILRLKSHGRKASEVRRHLRTATARLAAAKLIPEAAAEQAELLDTLTAREAVSDAMREIVARHDRAKQQELDQAAQPLGPLTERMLMLERSIKSKRRKAQRVLAGHANWESWHDK